MDYYLPLLNSENEEDFKIALSYYYQSFKHEMLLYMKRRNVTNPHDVLGEVFLSLSTRKSKKPITSARSYFFTCIKNQLKVKRNKFIEFKDIHLKNKMIHNNAFKYEEYQKLLNTVSVILNEREQHLFYMSLVENKRQVDIAEVCGVPPSNIRVRTFRIRQILQNSPAIKKAYIHLKQ